MTRKNKDRLYIIFNKMMLSWLVVAFASGWLEPNENIAAVFSVFAGFWTIMAAVYVALALFESTPSEQKE